MSLNLHEQNNFCIWIFRIAVYFKWGMLKTPQLILELWIEKIWYWLRRSMKILSFLFGWFCFFVEILLGFGFVFGFFFKLVVCMLMGKKEGDREILIFRYIYTFVHVCIPICYGTLELLNWKLPSSLKCHVQEYTWKLSFNSKLQYFEAFCSPHAQSSLSTYCISDAKYEIKKKKNWIGFRLWPGMLQPLACPSLLPLEGSPAAGWEAAWLLQHLVPWPAFWPKGRKQIQHQ